MTAPKKPPSDEPAVGLYFRVTLDGYDIGSFTSCKGLSFEVAVDPVEEGGNNAFVHKLPGRISYTNVTFTRAINKDSAKISKWFASMNGVIKRTNASIVITSSDPSHVVATWNLRDVIPVKWSGPDMTAGSSDAATETFEIAHHGFLAD